MSKLLDNTAKQLMIHPSVLLSIAKGAPYKYKKYTIPKKNGGERLIAQPTRTIKQCQRALVQEMRGNVKISGNATAYVNNKGIKANAIVHSSNGYLLKMDFSNFFNSIKPWMLEKALTRCGMDLTSSEKLFLANLLFHYPSRNSSLCLSIGAPSSPLISNIVMFDFDVKMDRYCSRRNISYTRYADDISFSTNEKGILFHLPKHVDALLQKEFGSAILVNRNKTVFSSRKHNRHVTGVVLNNEGHISLGRSRKRMISSLVHKFQLGDFENVNISYLQGMLAFANDIEPDFVLRLEAKYGAQTIRNIKIDMRS